MTKSVKEEMLGDKADQHRAGGMLSEEQKRMLEHRVRLITLMALTNKYSLLGTAHGAAARPSSTLPAKNAGHSADKLKANTDEESSSDEFESSSSESEEDEPEDTKQQQAEAQKPPAQNTVTSFTRLLRQFDSLKIALASLEVFKNLDYFTNYMHGKCKDTK